MTPQTTARNLELLKSRLLEYPLIADVSTSINPRDLGKVLGPFTSAPIIQGRRCYLFKNHDDWELFYTMMHHIGARKLFTLESAMRLP